MKERGTARRDTRDERVIQFDEAEHRWHAPRAKRDSRSEEALMKEGDRETR